MRARANQRQEDQGRGERIDTARRILPTRAGVEGAAQLVRERFPRINSAFYHGGEPIRIIRPFLEGEETKPYFLAMTAAGVGSLLICQRQLARYRRGSGGETASSLLVPVGAEDDQAVVSNLRTLKVAYVRLAVSARRDEMGNLLAAHIDLTKRAHVLPDLLHASAGNREARPRAVSATVSASFRRSISTSSRRASDSASSRRRRRSAVRADTRAESARELGGVK